MTSEKLTPLQEEAADQIWEIIYRETGNALDECAIVHALDWAQIAVEAMYEESSQKLAEARRKRP